MSRLERLVLLLDAESSSYVRNAAGDQLADVQKSHPDELFNLLGRIVPLLKSTKWDTRIATARAIGLIVQNVDWKPDTRRGVECKVEENESDVKPTEDVKVEEGVKEEASDPNKINHTSVALMRERLKFDTLDIKRVLTHGTTLLGSAGKEYDNAMQALSPEERLAQQRRSFAAKLGLAGQFVVDEDADVLLDDDELVPPKKKSRSRANPASYNNEPVKVSQPDAASGSGSGGNARLRALAKRKAKFGSKNANKVQILDFNADNSTCSSPTNKVIVEHQPDKVAEFVELLNVHDTQKWPFENICALLMGDLFDAKWEVRHGALLGLREIIHYAGNTAGMDGKYTEAENLKMNTEWLEDLACRFCCVFALDRFADYVADQIVVPVRESCAQALGTLLLHLATEPTRKVFFLLSQLVLQSELGFETPIWAVCQGGMLGLRYLVSVRTELLVSESLIFDKLIRCVYFGLNNEDDDVQAISAATLTPIAEQFVAQRPNDIRMFLDVIWNCLEDLTDDLSIAVGNVMDLLAKLCMLDPVLKTIEAASREDTNRSFSKLVPRLYPFLRHSVVDVRKAVLRCLSTFLTLKSNDMYGWVNVQVLRLVFQNILFEQNSEVLELSLNLWMRILDYFESSPTTKEQFAPIFAEVWQSAFSLLMTPIGSARKYYRMDESLLIKPSGSSYEADTTKRSRTTTASKFNIDGPVIQGDVLVVDYSVFLRSRICCSQALGRALSMAGIGSYISSILNYFDSPMSSQKLILMLLIEEYGKNAKKTSESLASLNPELLRTMEEVPKNMYRDLNPILRAVRTQCQSIFALMVSQGGLPQNATPHLSSLIDGDTNADDTAFSLHQAELLAGKEFDVLKAMLPVASQVKLADALTHGRRNLDSAISEAREALDCRSVSIHAGAAAAFYALNKDLPDKLNPIIRSLMDSLKIEANITLQDRTADTLASLMAHLLSSNRKSAGIKIFKNLCAFLCVDTNEAPVFTYYLDKHDDILSLTKDEMQHEDVSEQLKKQRESRVAFIKRNGALLVLEKIAKLYGGELFEKIDLLEVQMTEPLIKTDLATAFSEKSNEDSSKIGQALIDSITILRSILPFIDKSLHRRISAVFEPLAHLLICEYSVLRFVAAKCFASLCKYMPSLAIPYFIENILGQISNADNAHVRQGISECIYHIMSSMGEAVLSSIVFFIVPTLGRMSDSDRNVRLIAAMTFAYIIKLVPLESGVPDLPDMPASLLEGRDKEREFISQMMDQSKVKPFELPVNVKATLRKYQQEGVNWLAFLNKYHLHGILCDDMGLGKTLQTICIVASDHYMRAQKHEKDKTDSTKPIPSLIICPTTLTVHWVHEIATYVDGLSTLAYVGSPQVRYSLLKKIKKADVVITSYDVARNDVNDLSKFNWNYCVLDEGHIIKNANSKLSRAIKQYNSNHRLVLTGTPIQNNVLELWSLFDFLMPGFLGTEKSFDERFSKPITASRNHKCSQKEQELASLALDSLHKQVLPFTLRRLKEDVLDDLPPKVIQDYYCDLNERQRKLYHAFTQRQKQVVAEDLKQENKESKKHIFQALLYMRRLCNHPAFVTYTKEQLEKMPTLDIAQSPKLLALQQLLKDCGIGVEHVADDGMLEITSQHRALIFCQQKDMLDIVEKSLLKQHMPTVSYMRMDGSVPGPQRHEIAAKFNEDPSIDVLLLTTHVGGLGLNLTGADTVIFVEHDWNPMNDLQAMDRGHRIGQKKVVNVYRLITRGTLEERIMGLQQFKLNIASTVINQQNNGLMSMGTDQILDLFSGSSEVANPTDTQESQPSDDALDATGKFGGKNNITSGLEELWDTSQYAEEYNLDAFINSLKKSAKE